jgi:hypothetical protein
MTQMSQFDPLGVPQSDLPMSENPRLSLWRTVWLDLPLAWGREVDRFLFRWMEPPTTGKTISGDRADTGPPADGASHDEPDTPVEAVALGLGCGDYSEEVLG